MEHKGSAQKDEDFACFILLAETPKEGLDCSSLYHPAALAPVLSTLHEHLWRQQSQSSRQEGAPCAPTPHHKALKWVSTWQVLAGEGSQSFTLPVNLH